MSTQPVIPRASSEDPDDLSPLIEQIWHELDGRVPKTRIRCVAASVAARFSDATVTTNIPLFVRHLTREWLKEEIKNSGWGSEATGSPAWPAALALKILRHVFPKTLS